MTPPVATPSRSWLDALLDLTVVRSFDRFGFQRHARRFDEADLDVELTGKVALVTGANSGIGLATTRALAVRGARVWMLCRDRQRGARALEALSDDVPGADLRLGVVDVSDRQSIQAFVADFPEPRVDVLVHNAGVLPAARFETAEGLELAWATMVVGPFLLTWHLADRLLAAPQGRVVWVSSGGLLPVRLDLDGRAWSDRAFDGVRAYANAKRAQVILSEQWAMEWADTFTTSNAMHPGWADTASVASSIPAFHRLARNVLRTAEQGADTVVWLAAAPRLAQETGRFWFDRAPTSTHVFPWTREPQDERQRLWRLCQEEAGLNPR